jgi:hypothetical protein
MKKNLYDPASESQFLICRGVHYGRAEKSDEKNERNKKKHGISFEEAAGVFDDPFLGV